jgi:hypothetical protein
MNDSSLTFQPAWRWTVTICGGWRYAAERRCRINSWKHHRPLSLQHCCTLPWQTVKSGNIPMYICMYSIYAICITMYVNTFEYCAVQHMYDSARKHTALHVLCSCTIRCNMAIDLLGLSEQFWLSQNVCLHVPVRGYVRMLYTRSCYTVYTGNIKYCLFIYL